MTLAELLSNEELRQHEFPVAREHVFLAHAAVCPLPRRVEAAMSAYARACTGGDQEELLPACIIPETRALAGRLLEATPEEIALVGPTSLALSAVAAGLRVESGQNVIFYQDDYPSNVYPWLALGARGVELRRVTPEVLGRIQPADVLELVDNRTALVALASCHFVAGWRLDCQAIGAALRAQGVPFCVDAIQTLGAWPTPVTAIDFLAADAHKWLLGPCGAGLFFVRREWQDRLAPTAWGWHNLRCPNYLAQEQLEFRADARRYEPGTPNLGGIVGLHAALELVLELGVDGIARELERKRGWLVPALRARGWQVLLAEAPAGSGSAIISFSRPDTDMARLHRELAGSQIITSLRADRSGRQYIRLSPHFYNTDRELERLLERL
jgi:selenocysteine lyase/cysteine desulfurase